MKKFITLLIVLYCFITNAQTLITAQANQNYSTTTTQDTDGDGVTDDIDLDDDNDGISDVDEKLQNPNTFPAILNNAYKSNRAPSNGYQNPAYYLLKSDDYNTMTRSKMAYNNTNITNPTSPNYTAVKGQPWMTSIWYKDERYGNLYANDPNIKQTLWANSADGGFFTPEGIRLYTKDNKLHFFYGSTTYGSLSWESANEIPHDVWTNITVVYDGGTTGGTDVADLPTFFSRFKIYKTDLQGNVSEIAGTWSSTQSTSTGGSLFGVHGCNTPFSNTKTGIGNNNRSNPLMGKIAYFGSVTLNNGVPLPDTDEISMFALHPKQHETTYLEGQTRRLANNDVTNLLYTPNTRDAAKVLTSLWMGDGQGNSYNYIGSSDTTSNHQHNAIVINISEEFIRDTDGDGIPDHQDLDSDDDGCYDVNEAGFTDDNNDGVLDGTGIDTDGKVIGNDGYTTPADINANGEQDYIEATYKNVWGTCSSSVTNTWQGTTDNEWDTATNWSNSSVPTTSQNIIIPSGLTNYPTATSAVSFNTMTLKNGATFIMGNTVNGSNNINYQKSLPNTDWYLISPPVSGESIEDVISNHSLATGTGTNLGLANFINTNSSPWNYQSSTSTGILNAAQGYSVKLQAAADISFTGSANTSDVTYTVSGGNSNNFYLLGNPFTSYVNSTAFFNKNTANLSSQTIWLWEGTAYQTYNIISPIEIAPVQGFFVNIDDSVSNQNIVFETSNQSHQSTDTFKKEEPFANFELSMESNDAKSATKVFYVAGKTTGFDNGYDSRIFGGATHNFTVYTELVGDQEGTKLAIQTLDKDDTSIIPVGVIANVGKEITFSLESENLGDNVSIYLEDKLTGAFINVSETTYQTTITEEAEGVGRFYIHNTSASLSIENLNANNISIYKSSFNEITINGVTTKATFKMFSVTGKEVMHTRFASHGNKEIPLPSLAKGVYIVQLTTEAGTINKKIILE